MFGLQISVSVTVRLGLGLHLGLGLELVRVSTSQVRCILIALQYSGSDNTCHAELKRFFTNFII